MAYKCIVSAQRQSVFTHSSTNHSAQWHMKVQDPKHEIVYSRTPRLVRTPNGLGKVTIPKLVGHTAMTLSLDPYNSKTKFFVKNRHKPKFIRTISLLVELFF